jgi:hypothetical protein
MKTVILSNFIMRFGIPGISVVLAVDCEHEIATATLKREGIMIFLKAYVPFETVSTPELAEQWWKDKTTETITGLPWGVHSRIGEPAPASVPEKGFWAFAKRMLFGTPESYVYVD